MAFIPLHNTILAQPDTHCTCNTRFQCHCSLHSTYSMHEHFVHNDIFFLQSIVSDCIGLYKRTRRVMSLSDQPSSTATSSAISVFNVPHNRPNNVSHQAWALSGLVQFCDEPGRSLRLPPEVCQYIADLMRPRTWQTCHECGVTLLEIHQKTPFSSQLATAWSLDGYHWLLTDRGSIHTSFGHESRKSSESHQSRQLPSPAYSASGAPDELHLAGRFGCITPERTPATIVVHLHDEKRHLRFHNTVTSIVQRQWYKVVGGRHLCRSCVLGVRRRRVWFESWRHRAS